MIEYSNIKKINDALKLTPIKGKEYATVNQRVLGFREICPEGSIETEIVSIKETNPGVHEVIMRAIVRDGEKIIATGTAWEVSTASQVNRTSYIENCETSAVGRALGFLGIGAVDNIATLEELANAITQQQSGTSTTKKTTSRKAAQVELTEPELPPVLQDHAPAVCADCRKIIQDTKDKKGQTIAAEEQLQHTDQNDQGDEVGRREDGLQVLGSLAALHGVQGQGDDDGQREADDEADDAQQERVLHQRPELYIIEETGKVLEADPDGGVGQDLVTRHEVLEGDQHTIDGQVVEQEYHQDSGKQHDQVGAIFLQILNSLCHADLLLRLHRCGCFFSALHCNPPFSDTLASETCSGRFTIGTASGDAGSSSATLYPPFLWFLYVYTVYIV